MGNNPGTHPRSPLPVRRNTKHKRPLYGLELQRKAEVRRKRRTDQADRDTNPMLDTK